MSEHSILGKESLATRMKKIKEELDISEEQNILQENTQGTSVVSAKKIEPKLFVSGRLDRKEHTYTAKSLILLEQLENEIKTYCRGGDLAILNYLIKEGLKKVKSLKTTTNIDMTEIENDPI